MIAQKEIVVNGIAIQVTEYSPDSGESQGYADGGLRAFQEGERSLVSQYEKCLVKSEPVQNPMMVLPLYGCCSFLISSTEEQMGMWSGSKTFKGSFSDGEQAAHCLENILNRLNPLGGLIPYQLLHAIPFHARMARQTQTDARCLEVMTGADHPQLFWKQIVHGYIVEDSFRIDAVDSPRVAGDRARQMPQDSYAVRADGSLVEATSSQARRAAWYQPALDLLKKLVG